MIDKKNTKSMLCLGVVVALLANANHTFAYPYESIRSNLLRSEAVTRDPSFFDDRDVSRSGTRKCSLSSERCVVPITSTGGGTIVDITNVEEISKGVIPTEIININREHNALVVAGSRSNSYTSSFNLANVSAVGTALEPIGDAGDTSLDEVVRSIDRMSSASAVRSSLLTLRPDMSGIVTGVALDSAVAATDVIDNRVAMLNDASNVSLATGSEIKSNGVWGEVFTTAADQSERKGFGGYQSKTNGFVLGVDTDVSQKMKVGISFAYSDTNAKSANGASAIDSYQIGTYGTIKHGNFYNEGLIAYTASDIDTSRNINVGQANEQAIASFNGNQLSMKVGSGYKIKILDNATLIPTMALRYRYLALASYTETGSMLNLSSKNKNMHALESDIGVRFSYPFSVKQTMFVPKINTSWTYDFIGDEQEAINQFVAASGAEFVTKGPSIAQHTLNTGLGLDIISYDNVTVSLDYNWKKKEDYDSHNGSVDLRFAF